MSGLIGILAFVVLMLFAIFFHELGHFLTARWAGIKVSKFFIGFGPTLWSIRRGQLETTTGPDGTPVTRPETEYGVKALPLGGFVKIVGMSPYEDIPPEDVPRAFPAAPTWKRAIVLSAGSATHFVTAFFIMILIFMLIGVPDPDRPTPVVDAVATEIGTKDSPAVMAGLEPGDRIVEVDGKPVKAWDDVRDTIRAQPGEKIDLVIARDGQTRDVELTPAAEKERGKTIGVIGVYPRYESHRQNPIAAIGSSGRAMGALVIGFFQQVPKAFTPTTLGLTGDGPTNERPFSIIGAGKIAGDLFSRGSMLEFLFLFVQINIFIAIFNMLPLPPLDGGHLLVLGIEKIRRKPIDQRALVPVMAVVLSLLLLLGVLLIYYDIVEPPQLPVR